LRLSLQGLLAVISPSEIRAPGGSVEIATS
jgi:hypothetical protein